MLAGRISFVRAQDERKVAVDAVRNPRHGSIRVALVFRGVSGAAGDRCALWAGFHSIAPCVQLEANPVLL